MREGVEVLRRLWSETHVSRDAHAAREAVHRFSLVPIPQTALDARTAIGTADEVCAWLQRYVDAGCSKFVRFPIAAAGELIPQIELFGREILPCFA